MLIGSTVNAIAIIVGALLGLLLKRGIPVRVRDTVMQGIALCVLYIGIDGMLEGKNLLVVIISVMVGGLIGELLDLDARMTRLGDRLQRTADRLLRGSAANLSEGFVSSTLIYCVGAVAIMGALQDGLSGDHSLLFTKALLDGTSAIFFASSLGVGVLLSAVPVFLYQGSIAVLASVIAPWLGAAVIAEITCVGSILIVGLSLNLLGVTKIKVMNLLPACLLPLLLCTFL